MGNCTAPTSTSELDSGMAVGMLSKSAMLAQHRQSMALAEPNLSSNMFITFNLYTKIDGFAKYEETKQEIIPSLNESSTGLEDASPTLPPKRVSNAKPKQLILNYTVKYGEKEINWIEKNCNLLHRSKKLKIEYLLGYSD